MTGVASVEKAFDLLEFLALAGRSASLREAMPAIGLPQPSVYRLPNSLAEGAACLGAYLAFLGFPEAALGVAVPFQRLNARGKSMITHALKALPAMSHVHE